MTAESDPPADGLSRKSFLVLGGALVAAGVASPFGGGAASATTGATTATAAAAGAATAAAALARAASATTGGPIMNDGRFPIGLFWPPPPTETTVERYREIAEAGFTYVHGGNYSNSDVQITTHMLRVADEAGVYVLVEDPEIKWLLQTMNVGDPAQPFTISEDELRQRITNAVNRYAPSWRTVGGRLHVLRGSGSGSIGWVADGAAWQDYTFAFDTEPLRTGAGGYAQAGWAFRIKDEANAYVWLLSTQGSDGKAVLKKAVFVNGNPIVTQVALPYQLEEGRTYHVETALSGSTITTRIDGVLVDTTTDSTHAAGSAGFREAGSESAYFDNVVITGAGGATLFRDSFDEGLGAWRLPAGSGYGAFAGLHLFDEPSVARLPLVAKAVAMANDAYADALSYVNLFPGFGAGYEQAARDIDSPVLSFDRYPILASGEDLGYFDNWAQVRAAALKHGRDPWIYIQSVGYANHAIPTKADLLWQISISLAYGCKGIQYFTYWTPDPARGEAFTNGLITVEGKRTGLYRDTKQVNADYLAPLGKQMLELTSTAVQVAGLANPPAGLAPFEGDALVSAVSGDPVVLGRFVDADDRLHTLVANYSRRDRARVSLTLPAEAEAYDPGDDDWSRQRSGGLTLRAGEARLLRMR
ncbi:hypothetical protein KV102_00240 [Mumia sp. zg.B53]|uniref:hypothetical protein n=1 Tax=Mumia sp. zg.B53 TaxID=2855449 RepID=UPI001C6E3632|nr:hypothetical protein [Mumia sp. zg.B53]MBW9213254.1 hypothetical protein [Mumia sp. zg.B53]